MVKTLDSDSTQAASSPEKLQRIGELFEIAHVAGGYAAFEALERGFLEPKDKPIQYWVLTDRGEKVRKG